jgi:hypothetical protein
MRAAISNSVLANAVAPTVLDRSAHDRVMAAGMQPNHSRVPNPLRQGAIFQYRNEFPLRGAQPAGTPLVTYCSEVARVAVGTQVSEIEPPG